MPLSVATMGVSEMEIEALCRKGKKRYSGRPGEKDRNRLDRQLTDHCRTQERSLQRRSGCHLPKKAGFSLRDLAAFFRPKVTPEKSEVVSTFHNHKYNVKRNPVKC